jgi:hypothetical protein
MSSDPANSPDPTADMRRSTWKYRVNDLSRPRWVEYPAATDVQDRILDAYYQPRSSRMENILFMAESGMGKTALIERLKRRTPEAFDKLLSIHLKPVIYLNMPPNPGEKDFLHAILRASKTSFTPRAHWGEPPLRDWVIKRLQQWQTHMMIIEGIEAVRPLPIRARENFLQLLRYMSDDVQMAFVCTGSLSTGSLFQIDPQVASRFHEVSLPVWRADNTLKNFLMNLIKTFRLEENSEVDNNMLKLIAERSGGITAQICAAIRRAAITAVKTGREIIDLEILGNDAVWRPVVPCRPFSIRKEPSAAVSASEDAIWD